MKTTIEWAGKGYYRRERHYSGSTENGITWIGHKWVQTWHGDPWGHKVNDAQEIRRTLEKRYHTHKEHIQ